MTTLSLSNAANKVSEPSPSYYLYCDSEEHTNSLVDHIKTFLTTEKANHPIFLDCEGRDLGRIGGKLGLIQLGVESKVYLVDVITYPQALVPLKTILEDPKLEKVVWIIRSYGTAMELS